MSRALDRKAEDRIETTGVEGRRSAIVASVRQRGFVTIEALVRRHRPDDPA
jgi:DeoR family transcriptional regulator, glycerol-3-phosphate regulon repressor